MGAEHPFSQMPYYDFHLFPVIIDETLPRYKLKCSRDPGTSEITAAFARAAVSLLKRLLTEGQEKWESLNEECGHSARQNMALWREWMAAETEAFRDTEGPTLLIRDLEGLPSATVTFQMCKTDSEFYQIGTVLGETVVTDLSHLHSADAPSAVITWAHSPDQPSEPGLISLVSPLIVPESQHKTYRRILFNILDDISLEDEPERPSSAVWSSAVKCITNYLPENFWALVMGEVPPDEEDLSTTWTNLIGCLAQGRLLDDMDAVTTFWEPLERGTLSAVGFMRLESTLVDTVEDLKKVYPELAGLRVQVIPPSTELEDLITWTRLIARAEPSDSC